MNQESLDLALLGIELANKELSPAYTEAREQLRSSLGTTSIEGFQKDTESRKENVDLVVDLLRLFPPHDERHRDPYSYRAPGFPYAVITEDEAEYGALKASILWEQRPYSFSDIKANYIIGQRLRETDSDYPIVDLLLSDVFSDLRFDYALDLTSILTIASAYYHEFAAVEQEMARSLVDVHPDELKKAYNHSVESYTYEENNGISVKKIKEGSRMRPIRFNGSTDNPDDLSKLYQKISGKGGLRLKPFPKQFDTGISDKDIADFDVFHNLTRLGLRFNVLDKMTKLIVENASSRLQDSK